MAPTGKAYKVDWIFAEHSDVHVAQHRDWFTEFNHIKSSVRDRTYMTEDMYPRSTSVKGIGTVKLEVKTHPECEDEYSSKALTLKDVLYCPDMNVNIIGMPITKEYPIWHAGIKMTTADEATGFIFDRLHKPHVGPGLLPPPTPKIWLVGHQKGESSLNPWDLRIFQVHWPDYERNRINGILEKRRLSATADKPSAASKVPKANPSDTSPSQENSPQSGKRPTKDDTVQPYTIKETMAYLRDHHPREYWSLRSYCLANHRGSGYGPERLEPGALMETMGFNGNDVEEVEDGAEM